jgi:NAD(P)-dependent dehydrogenase (short-subunit alcohol dehydrogenase family)
MYFSTMRQNNCMTTSGSKQIAIVTGSNKGIGRAIVLTFATSTEYKDIVTNSEKIEEA